MGVLFELTPNVSAEAVTPVLPENLQYVRFLESQWNPTGPTVTSLFISIVLQRIDETIA